MHHNYAFLWVLLLVQGNEIRFYRGRYIKNMNHTSLCDTSLFDTRLCDTSLFYVLLTRSMSIVTTRHPCVTIIIVNVDEFVR